MRQTLRHEAATIRPILRVLFASVLVLSLFSSAGRANNNAPSRRDAAKAQFERAEKAREALEARPESARTLKDYTTLVIEYQRVYLITSHASDVPASLNHVAELFRTMGDLFDAKYYQRSIESFQFLMQQYPTSKYREDALLAIAHIEQDDLHDSALAQKTYQQFLALHPRSSHAAEVRVILDKLNAESAAAKPSPPSPGRQGPLGPDRSQNDLRGKDSADDGHETRLVRGQFRHGRLRLASLTDSHLERRHLHSHRDRCRIESEISGGAHFGPDRIYFDIEGAKVSSALLHNPIDIDSGGFLKTVRVAQYQTGVVRVVLEVNRVSDYSVFLLPDPYRLVVDVYGNSAAAEAAAREHRSSAWADDDGRASREIRKACQGSCGQGFVQTSRKSRAKSAPAPSTDALLSQRNPSLHHLPPTPQPKRNRRQEKHRAIQTRIRQKTAVAASTKPVTSQDSDTDGSTLSAAAAPADTEIIAPPNRPHAPKKSSRATKSAHDQAEEMGPPPTPELTRDGQHSLTRALGLKIGRIVIDAGHGGHDTGTIGPTGLMEKDLCLDVALRLGKIIQQRLPSADVVFTRNDDTFIPLERRTEIANEAKADLFISVHANSSQDHKARGIETYYLNFTGSSDAMEVASRENALVGKRRPRPAGHRHQNRAQRKNRGIPRSRHHDSGFPLQAHGESQPGRPQPRRAQGALCRSDRRGHALRAGRNFVPLQSQRREVAQEPRQPPAGRRRPLPRH